jgi:phosphonate transport system substrate-binding protein
MRIYRDGHRHQFHLSRRAVLCGFTALTRESPFPGSNDSGFTFGLTPVFLDNNMPLLSLLQEYLSLQLDRPIVLVKRRTYREIATMLLSGQLDAAWIGACLF